MEVAAFVVSAFSLIIAAISFAFSIKSQHLQDKVNELDVKLKEIELEKREKENEKEPCVKARIVNLGRNKNHLRIYNSGNANAYNITASFENEAIPVLNKEKMPYEILEPGESFDLSIALTYSDTFKFNVTTKWQDENENEMQKTQVCDI